MTDVIAGQTVALLAQWYEFEGGPLTDLDITPTIGITRVATGDVVLPATSSGVTHPGVGSYAYAWTPAADSVPGLYLALWSGVKDGSPVTASETVTVAAPTMGRVYATAADYEAYTGQTPPTGINGLLADASRFLEANVFRLCLFEADADTGLPTNQFVINAFRDAVCAQARWYDDIGDTTGAAGAGWGSVSLGSAQLSRSVANVTGNASAAREIAPAVWDALTTMDLTPDVFVLGQVTQR